MLQWFKIVNVDIPTYNEKMKEDKTKKGVVETQA